MVNHQPFKSARVKLERARSVTGELQQVISRFSGAKLVAEDWEGRPGMIRWVVRMTTDPADAVVSRLGDAVHNLRAALDHAAVGVVKLNGKDPKGVHFPFATDAAELDRAIKDKRFNRASPEAVDLLKKMRPYKGGNDALRALHDLDILDKHHALIPVWSGATQKLPLQTGGLSLTGNTFDMREGQCFLACPGQAQGLRPHPLSLHAAFAGGQPFASQEVVPILARLSQLVGGIIQAFAALYGG